MAHNPQAPQGPQGAPDPAGSTQMFRAFVDEEPQGRQAAQQRGGGSKTGMTVGIVIAVVVILAVVGWLAFS
jgi:hypothetical protein